MAENKLLQLNEALHTLIESASKPGNLSEKVSIMPVQSWLIQTAASAGLKVNGFDHTLDSSAVRHIRKAHGNPESEKARGQLPVTDEDLIAIPEIITTPDKVIFGTRNRTGRDQIIYLRKMSDGTTLYLEEVRTGRKELAAHTMRRYPATMNAKSIVSTLNLYARYDGRNKLTIVNDPANVNIMLNRRTAQTQTLI